MFGTKKLICVMSPKGGVGKSFFSRILASVMIEKFGKDKVVLVDADHFNKSLFRTYEDDCKVIDLTKQSGRDKLVSIAEAIHDQGIEQHMIIDFAGGSINEIQERFAGDKDPSAFFDTVKEFGFEPVIAVSFNYELLSQLAFADIYKAFGKNGTNAKYFFIQNCKGIQEESEVNNWFDGYDGSMEDIEYHKFYSSFVPRDFAVKNLGLDINERDESGTTSNLFRAPAMPGNLAKWIYDAVKFDEETFYALPRGVHRAATRYFDKVKSRLLTTDLLSTTSGTVSSSLEIAEDKPKNKPDAPKAKYSNADLQAELMQAQKTK
jgi:hypothetical protein